MALITAGLALLYIIHGLKIMLALLGLRPHRLIQKKKKKKKKAISTRGKWKAVKVFEKKVVWKLKLESRKLVVKKYSKRKMIDTLFYQNP